MFLMYHGRNSRRTPDAGGLPRDMDSVSRNRSAKVAKFLRIHWIRMYSGLRGGMGNLHPGFHRSLRHLHRSLRSRRSNASAIKIRAVRTIARFYLRRQGRRGSFLGSRVVSGRRPYNLGAKRRLGHVHEDRLRPISLHWLHGLQPLLLHWPHRM